MIYSFKLSIDRRAIQLRGDAHVFGQASAAAAKRLLREALKDAKIVQVKEEKGG